MNSLVLTVKHQEKKMFSNLANIRWTLGTHILIPLLLILSSALVLSFCQVEAWYSSGRNILRQSPKSLRGKCERQGLEARMVINTLYLRSLRTQPDPVASKTLGLKDQELQGVEPWVQSSSFPPQPQGSPYNQRNAFALLVIAPMLLHRQRLP